MNADRAQGRTSVADAPTDQDLLRAHVAGDPEAFGLLVARHQDRLWAVALRTLQNPDEAADALQEALISAFRRADTFRGESKVTTWLHRIVINACLDHIRRRRSRRTEPLPEDTDRLESLGEPVSDDPVLAGELHADVVLALGRLNTDQRAAIVLVDMEGYSVEEAALILGCAPGTVKSRCHRGRARLVPLLSAHRLNGGDDGQGTESGSAASHSGTGSVDRPARHPAAAGQATRDQVRTEH